MSNDKAAIRDLEDRLAAALRMISQLKAQAKYHDACAIPAARKEGVGAALCEIYTLIAAGHTASDLLLMDDLCRGV